MDVWRFGPQSFCTFGIEYTNRQIREITKAFKKVFIIFDPEPQATKQAVKLMNELKFRGIEANTTLLDSDPGSMKQDDADTLIKQLLS